MAEVTAVYRAVGDFSNLKRQADSARRSMRRLKDETSDTQADYVAGQEEVTEATDDSTDSQTRFTKALVKVKKTTAQTTKEETKRVDVIQSTVATIGKQSAAQRENTRLQVVAARAKDSLTLAEQKYTRVAEDAAATDRDRAKALDDVRLASIGAAAANDQLVASMARLAVGGGGRGGRPRGPGLATDVGAFGRALVTVAGGALATLLLVVPTINTIIAGLIGVISLLTAGAVAAAAFAAAFIVVGAAMGVAALKFRNLISQSTDGVSEWRAAIVAIEAAAFDAFLRVAATFKSTGEAGTSMWDSIANAAITLIDKMTPYIQKAVDLVVNFTSALSGDVGAYSPFLNFMETWLGQWKQLQKIANRDILPGGPSFFEKYEEPAKAFVQGIARVINAIRKFSAMGLGLNMDQLAEFIRTVFDVLSQLIGIVPRYSNALVEVGLATAKFAQSLLPLIDNAIKVGEVILKDVVAPLVKLIEDVLSVLLNLPVVDWIIALGAGFLIAAKGVSVLSFGLLKFDKIIKLVYLKSLIGFGQKIIATVQLTKNFAGVVDSLAVAGLPKLSKAFAFLGTVFQSVGQSIASIAGRTKELGARMAGFIGGFAISAAIIAGYFALQAGLDAIAKSEEEVRKKTEEVSDAFADGNVTIEQARKEIRDFARQQAESAGILERFVSAIMNLGDTMLDYVTAGHLGQDATEQLNERFQQVGLDQFNADLQDLVQNATAGVRETGALTASQAEFIKGMEDAQGGAQWFAQFLRNLTELYKNHTINAGQYATALETLGVEFDATGEEVDLMSLKIKGASEIISQAILDIGDDALQATGGIERLGRALGEDTVAFAREATDAFMDVQGGILGTGEKVKQWLVDTSDAIRQWKTEVADSFNIVKQAFIDLGGEAKLTWDKFKRGIDDAIEAAQEMQDNIKYILDHGAGPLLKQLIAENGPALASLYEVLATQGPKAIQEANRALRSGVDIAGGTADALGEALGLSMERVVAAIEVMVSHLLGIPVGKVHKEVEAIVGDVEKTTSGITPIEQRLTEHTVRARPLRRPAQGMFGADPHFARATGAAGPVGMFGPITKPPKGADQEAMRSQYETVGRVGVAGGMAAGIAQGTPEVKTATVEMANRSINAANDAFGIASPARVFISIGGAVMMGLAQGFKNGTTLIVTTLQGIRDKIIEVFTEAGSWVAATKTAFKELQTLLIQGLTPAVEDLQTALENLPATVEIAFDLDTSKAEAAAATFIENMEKKGLIFTSPTGVPVQHEGGPAGHSARFASGRPRSGEVDARLQKGEFVVSRKGVQNMGGMGTMSEFHDFITGKRLFHDGGPVDESEVTSFKIRRLAESLGLASVSATGVLPKQDMQSLVSVSAPGAGRVGALTAAAANYMATIKKNFPMISGYGTTAVRTIAGTSTWSQHAYSNAIDVMTGSSTALRQAVAFFSNQYRRILSIAHLLADPWFASPRGDHYNHVHADFFPQYGGTPPGHPVGYRRGGKVRARGGRVHQNEFVLRDAAAMSLGESGLSYLNANAERLGPAAYLEAFNRSFATTALPHFGGVGMGEGPGDRARFSIAMHLDGKSVTRSVEVYSREADILLPGR